MGRKIITWTVSMRLTRKIFTDLAIFMMGFGVLIGIVFPFFMVAIGIPMDQVFTVAFFISCILAGVVVGAINILLARSVVGKRIALLSKKMGFISGKLSQASSISELEECNSDECRLVVDSDDELGEGARSFNTLLDALSSAISSEAAVRQFNIIMSSQLELPSLSKHALDYILSYCGAAAGCVVIERGGEFSIPYASGIQNTDAILANVNLWKLFEARETKSVSLDLELQVDSLLVSFRPREVHVVPLVYKAVPLGLLLLGSEHPVEIRKLQTIEMFAQSFAITLNNSITYDQLQRLAANDPLTGLYNRRFGMARLSEEFMRSVRTQSPLGVLMFDIDHFKSVNDTYGHAAGDKVLVNVSKIAVMAARKGDLIIRYGGEEFIMILPGADKKDCRFIAERLRHMVEESSLQVGVSLLRITISVGLVSYPEYSVEQEQTLVKLADQAMYVAKEQGRNMVVEA